MLQSDPKSPSQSVVFLVRNSKCTASLEELSSEDFRILPFIKVFVWQFIRSNIRITRERLDGKCSMTILELGRMIPL